MRMIISGFIMLVPMMAYSQKDSIAPTLLIKPEASIGYSTFNGGCLNWQVGGSVMTYANKTQRYGLTANYINIGDGNIEYVSTGIVLEMTLWKYFYARVGTVGYFGIKNASNAFGLTSNIGFEYTYKFFVLSGGYKADGLFISGLPSNNNFYLQTSFRIDRKVKPKKPKQPKK